MPKAASASPSSSLASASVSGATMSQPGALSRSLGIHSAKRSDCGGRNTNLFIMGWSYFSEVSNLELPQALWMGISVNSSIVKA